jgi:hypothetical protein
MWEERRVFGGLSALSLSALVLACSSTENAQRLDAAGGISVGIGSEALTTAAC